MKTARSLTVFCSFFLVGSFFGGISPSFAADSFSTPRKTATVPDDFPTFAAALNAPEAFDVVRLKEGVHPVDEKILIKRDVEIVGLGDAPSKTVLALQKTEKGQFMVCASRRSDGDFNVKFRNLTLKGIRGGDFSRVDEWKAALKKLQNFSPTSAIDEETAPLFEMFLNGNASERETADTLPFAALYVGSGAVLLEDCVATCDGAPGVVVAKRAATLTAKRTVFDGYRCAGAVVAEASATFDSCLFKSGDWYDVFALDAYLTISNCALQGSMLTTLWATEESVVSVENSTLETSGLCAVSIDNSQLTLKKSKIQGGYWGAMFKANGYGKIIESEILGSRSCGVGAAAKSTVRVEASKIAALGLGVEKDESSLVLVDDASQISGAFENAADAGR